MKNPIQRKLPWLSALAAAALAQPLEAQQVIFSEIMYNPPDALPEYIEVVNNTATPYDIALWELRGGVNYDFPDFTSGDAELTFLKAYERILISSVSANDLRQAYPGIPAATRIYGPWDGIGEDGVRTFGNLKNGGESLTLKDKNDSLICSLSFDDDPLFWPVAADGPGHSLQVINPDGKIEDWRNWRASSKRGGSPGTADLEWEPSALSLSEVSLNADGKIVFVELYNSGSVSAVLDDFKFRVPDTAIENGVEVDASDEVALSGQIAPRGYVAINVDLQIDDLDNVQILLLDSDGNVVSGHAIAGANEATYQTHPAGSSEWYRTSEASKGSVNDPVRFDDIVISEIMYAHPVGGIGEFIELYNKGDSEITLSGWEITKGVSFTFPNGSTIAPKGYAFIAADTVWCEENYANIITPLGDFEGSLSNEGETIRIVDAAGNLVDQVSYGAGGEWPELADGLGSSLELVHPDMDNNRGSAWRDSDESQKSEMREYSVSVKYDSKGVWDPISDDEFHMHLVGEGYLVLKDLVFSRPVSLFNPVSTTLLVNSDRESISSQSNSGWVFQGTHGFGFYKDGEIHAIATGRGDNRSNRIEIDMADPGSSTDINLTFKARWIHGKSRLITQTSDHAWSHEFLIDVPTNLGTPGSANSQAAELAMPQIDSLKHHPAVPTATDDVIVSARVSAADGLDSVRVAYIDDGIGGNTESLFRKWKRGLMNDTGIDGDVVAGDGLYSYKITDMKVDGRIVAFYVEATNSTGQRSEYPQGGSARPALYIVDAPATDFELRTVRAVVGQQDLDRIQSGTNSKHDGKFPRSSNHYWNSTVIYNESEVYYNTAIRSAGSPWHTGERANLGLKGKWKMPKSNAFRDRTKTTYDQDPTSGRAHNDRVIRYWLYLLGHKINDNEFIKFTVNANNFATREEVEAPNSPTFMDRSWENGSQGHMYRIDDEWDFGDNIDNSRQNRDADWNYKSPNGNRAGRYHSEYMLRSRETEYDYTGLIGGFQVLTETDYTQEDAARYFDIKMIAINAAARGYIHDWDFQTLDRGKNTFFYQRPDDGLFQYLHWDSDLAFDNATAAFKTGRGATLTGFLRKPWFQRWFKFYLNDLVDNYSNTSLRFQTWLELEDTSTKDQGADINRYIRWGEQRKAPALKEIGNDRNSTFEITSNGGKDLSTTDDVITLEGTSSIDVYEVVVLDHPEAEIAWTGTVEYKLSGIVLKEGANALSVRALDTKGNELGSLFSPKKDTITVTKTNPSKPIAELAFSPASLNVSLGQSLEIDASGSWDPEGDALTFSFQAPNGAAIASDGAVAMLAFDQPGLVPVTIKITDANGNTAEVIREVSVYGGNQGFEDFSARRIADYWQTENIDAYSTTFQPSFYEVGDPDGMLSVSVAADSAKPLKINGKYPVIHRALPAHEDFSLQTKLILANLQFGAFHTGVVAEMTINGQARRFAFGIKGGTGLTVSEVNGSTVTDLATFDRNEGRATVRIRRSGTQLSFDFRESNVWQTVHTLALAGDAAATQGGIFVATDEAVGMRVLFDYAMLVDTAQVSDLQKDLRLTEVMYNPANGDALEFLEMQNIGTGTLDLNGAHFTAGIDYNFGSVLLGSGQFIIVARDTDAFSAHYNAAGAQVVGGYDGRLSNSGETIELVDAEERLIFSFTYNDRAPWPAEADGQGNSLEVIDPSAGVNNAANWQVSAAVNGSPGVGGQVVEPDPNDTDGDGLPNAWETQYGLDPSNRADAIADNDQDGSANSHEYIANTDPTDAASYLTTQVTRAAASATIGFTQQPARKYLVEFTDDLAAKPWNVLETVEPSAATQQISSIDAGVVDSEARYYRIRVSLP